MSTLKADTIQNTSGGAVTLTNQEATKARVMYDHVNTNVDGSFNISSVTDDNTGRHQPNFTSNISLGFSTVVSSPNTSSGQNDTSVRGKGNSVTTQNTSGYLVLTYTSTTALDMELDASITVGDLV
tara:strand:+ start:2557 stop:2934 length:378 start_codon:yes stop_codon:yes gene_type:complete